MWTFWQRTPEEFAQACVHYDLAPLQPTPLTRNMAFWEAYITTIISYLSNGNLHTPKDAWIEDVQEGNKVPERNLLIETLDCEASAVAAMKDLAKLLQKTSRYMGAKVSLAETMVAKFNAFRELENSLNNLS